MGYRDGVVVVGQAVGIMALMDRSQFGILFVTYIGIFLTISIRKTIVFLLLFTPEFILLRLCWDEL